MLQCLACRLQGILRRTYTVSRIQHETCGFAWGSQASGFLLQGSWRESLTSSFATSRKLKTSITFVLYHRTQALCACSSALAWSFESLPRAGLSFRAFGSHAFATVLMHLKCFLRFLLHAVLRSRAVSTRFPPNLFCVICSVAEPRDLWGNLRICLLRPVDKTREHGPSSLKS